jgi:hypothetical protein
MDTLHLHLIYTRYRRPAYQPRPSVTRGRWSQPDLNGARTGSLLVGIGVILLACFALAAPGASAGSATLLLMLGSPFLLFGGLLLLFALGAYTLRRLRRIKRHCGRCRFYQPFEGQYALGHCRADPRQALVQRGDGCPFFSYSERALVRERFAQHLNTLQRARHMPETKGNHL